MKYFNVTLRTQQGNKSIAVMAEDEQQARVLAADKMESGGPLVSINEVSKLMYQAIRSFK